MQRCGGDGAGNHSRRVCYTFANASCQTAREEKVPRTMAVHVTPREKQIVRLLSLGCSVNEAAKILKLAPSTVDNHRTRIMAKFGTDKTVLLTRLALKYRLTSMKDKLTLTEKRRSGRKRDGWN